MEYFFFSLAVLGLFTLIAGLLYVIWLFNYGVEEYEAGRISIRKSIGMSLKPYNGEIIRSILKICRDRSFLTNPIAKAEPIIPQVCVVLTENLYAGGMKCIGLAKRVQFMGLPGDGLKRYIIFLDLASIRSRGLMYSQIEGLIRHEFTHHYCDFVLGRPDPEHTEAVWKLV